MQIYVNTPPNNVFSKFMSPISSLNAFFHSFVTQSSVKRFLSLCSWIYVIFLTLVTISLSICLSSQDILDQINPYLVKIFSQIYIRRRYLIGQDILPTYISGEDEYLDQTQRAEEHVSDIYLGQIFYPDTACPLITVRVLERSPR